MNEESTEDIVLDVNGNVDDNIVQDEHTNTNKTCLTECFVYFF